MSSPGAPPTVTESALPIDLCPIRDCIWSFLMARGVSGRLELPWFEEDRHQATIPCPSSCVIPAEHHRRDGYRATSRSHTWMGFLSDILCGASRITVFSLHLDRLEALFIISSLVIITQVARHLIIFAHGPRCVHVALVGVPWWLFTRGSLLTIQLRPLCFVDHLTNSILGPCSLVFLCWAAHLCCAYL